MHRSEKYAGPAAPNGKDEVKKAKPNTATVRYLSFRPRESVSAGGIAELGSIEQSLKG